MLELPSNGIHDLMPTKRSRVIHAYKNRNRGILADDAASRLAAALDLDPGMDAQDVEVAAEQQNRALQRILDPSSLTSLQALSVVWQAPAEIIIAEALKAWAAIRPDGRLADSSDILI